MKAFLLLLSVLAISTVLAGNPTVIFHGIGDSCDNEGDIEFTQMISKGTGAYATCVVIGDKDSQGMASWVMPLQQQGASACSQIQADPNLQGDINVIGLSQGGLLARYIVEKCELKGRVSHLLSIAGPQMGVNAIPNCSGDNIFCNFINGVTKDLVYTSFIQDNVAPSGYFVDMEEYSTYLEDCEFLPDLNNERSNKSDVYKANMVGLDHAMFVMFNGDTVLDPPSTAWWSYFSANGTIVPMQDQEIYTEDWIGLKTLDEAGKLQFVALPGNHLDFTLKDIQTIFIPFLNNGSNTTMHLME